MGSRDSALGAKAANRQSCTWDQGPAREIDRRQVSSLEGHWLKQLQTQSTDRVPWTQRNEVLEMSRIHGVPGISPRQASPRPDLQIVPAIPHIDQRTDTVPPPWTVPSTPSYDLDPHLEIAWGADGASASVEDEPTSLIDRGAKGLPTPPNQPVPPTSPEAA